MSTSTTTVLRNQLSSSGHVVHVVYEALWDDEAQGPRGTPEPPLHRRLVVSCRLFPAITAPGLSFIEAWVNCHNSRSRGDPTHQPLHLRNIMWDPVSERGVLTDFDHDGSSEQVAAVGNLFMVADLLDCKESCDNRTALLTRDLIEPYMWMLVSTYLNADVAEDN